MRCGGLYKFVGKGNAFFDSLKRPLGGGGALLTVGMVYGILYHTKIYADALPAIIARRHPYSLG